MSKPSIEMPDGKDELSYKYPKNEEPFEEELSRKLKSDPYLEIHSSDIRAWRAFRRAFNLYHMNLNKKEILVFGEDRDLSITRAFNLDSSAHLTFTTENKAAAHMLRVKGDVHAIKADPEWHQFDKRGFIVVAMDDNIRVTKHLLKNVEPGGWFLCGIQVANALRGTGNYKLMGVIERGGSYPTVNKNVGEEFWAKMEIVGDEELRNAPETDGIVTFDQAKGMVEKAGMSTSSVLESYKRLIELAKKDGTLKPNGNFVLTLNVKGEGVTIDDINPVLPTKENEHGKDTVVMKREKGI